MKEANLKKRNDTHVLFSAARDPFRTSDCGEERHPDIASVAIASESDRGHAHPQRLASGSSASVGENIKRYVQLAI